MMYKESGYYPEGSEFDPNAPWNREDPPKRKFDVYVSQSLSKSTSVVTNDYTPDENGEADTRTICWSDVYSESEHYTPLQLIGLLSRILEQKIKETRSKTKKQFYKFLIEECNGWIEDETVFEEI